ncbi:unnamed protein product [Lota lota]
MTIKNMERSITILLLWCILQDVGGQDWTVFLPESVVGLEGSCVRIPCSFTCPQGWDYYLDNSCKAQWLRGVRRTLVFDSSLDGDRNLLQGELVGNLKHKNCTTIFHNFPTIQSKHYFRIECNNGLKTNFFPGVDITVKDVWEPVLSPRGKVEVEEGRPVMLSCSTLIPCHLQPPTLSWTPNLGDTQQEIGVEVVTSVLTFNASSLHHGEKIICSSLYKRQAGHSNISFEQHLTINVLYPPVNVSVKWPSNPVLEGSYVRLSCNGSANPPVDSYTWYRSRLHPGTDQGPNQGPLDFHQSISVSVSEDTQFFCEVRNRYGAKNTSLTQMDVHFPPKEVELRVEPPGGVQEGLGFTLSCSCRAWPPSSSYTWYWVSGVAPGVRVPLPDHGANFTVERAERRHSGRYYCLARNYLGVKESDPVHLDIHFAAEILNSSHCVRLPSGVRCSCESQGNPVPLLAWKLAGDCTLSPATPAHCSIREFQTELGIISVISLPQSDKDPHTVVCLSNNSVGNDRLELNLASCEIQPAFHAVSLLIGWTAGSVVMMLLCTLFHVTLCRRWVSK